MSSSTVSSRARQQGGGSGGRQFFPVGARRRHVPVVDGGCGCRPRRPRLLLLLSLPSFLKLISGCRLGGGGGVKAATTVRRRGTSSSSSTSTASFSSSSSSGGAAATHSTTGYSSSAGYSDDYYSYGGAGAAATTKTKQQQPEVLRHKAVVASPARAASAAGKKQKKKRHESSNKQMAEEEGVGVAVEKESCDPRADFRDSMVQMVVETGLCDWDGLRCMLRRLLALNAPRHHAAILTAFAEVCAQIVAAPSPAASPLHPSPSRSPAAYGQYRRG